MISKTVCWFCSINLLKNNSPHRYHLQNREKYQFLFEIVAIQPIFKFQFPPNQNPTNFGYKFKTGQNYMTSCVPLGADRRFDQQRPHLHQDQAVWRRGEKSDSEVYVWPVDFHGAHQDINDLTH